MRRQSSVQTTRLDLEAISEGVMRFRGPRFRAVLEVDGVPFGLKSDTEQEAIVASFAGFLNSLSFAIQLLVRIVPIDVDRYVHRIEQRARQVLPGRVAELALDHIAFVRARAQSQTLVEHHFYVIVPAQDRRLRWLPRLFRKPPSPELEAEAARRLLQFRCDEVARQLGRCGLGVRRLDDTELAQLQYACWCPERARWQRLRGNLPGYTSLAVRGARRSTQPQGAQAA